MWPTPAMMLVVPDASIRLADCPDSASTRVLTGIERVSAALRRRYAGTAGIYGAGQFCWLGGRVALALRAGDAEALGDLPVDVHLRHPEWFDETQLDHWFGDLFPSIERPERAGRLDGRVDRRGLAARLLHTLSLDDADRINVVVIDGSTEIARYDRVPVLTAGHVALAELWRVAICLNRPIAHTASIGRCAYALVTLLEAERRLGAGFSSEIRAETERLASLPVRTRRDDDASTEEVVRRVASAALERLCDPFVVMSTSREFGTVDVLALDRVCTAVQDGLGMQAA